MSTTKRKRGATSASGGASSKRGKNAIKKDTEPVQSATDFFNEESDRIEKTTKNARKVVAHHITMSNQRKSWLKKSRERLAKNRQMVEVLDNLDKGLSEFGRSVKSKIDLGGSEAKGVNAKAIDRDIKRLKEQYKEVHQHLEHEYKIAVDVNRSLSKKVEELESCLREMRENLTWTTTYAPVFKRKDSAIGLLAAPLNMDRERLQSIRSAKKTEADQEMAKEING